MSEIVSEIVRMEPQAPAPAPHAFSLNEMMSLAKAMAGSGLFASAQDANKALAVMMVGQEMGIGPAASLMGVSLINGKPQLGANLLAAQIKRSGKYNYRILEHTADVCEIAFYEGGQEVGRSRFSVADAQQAGYTRNPQYKSNPRNMLFARALSNGAKWYAPDCFGGVPVYHEGELEMGSPTPAPTYSGPVEPSTGEVAPKQERQRNTPPAGAEAFGYEYDDWPAPAQFTKDPTEKQVQMIARMAADRGVSAEEVDFLSQRVCDSLEVAKNSAGGASVTIGFLKNATSAQIDLAMERQNAVLIPDDKDPFDEI